MLPIVHIWRDLASIPTPAVPSVVTIGVFDGIHRGHQQLITTTVQTARAQGVRSVVVTFDPHPRAVLRGDAPPRLTSLARRLELTEQLGVDAVFVVPFTRELSQVPAEEFLRSHLIEPLAPTQIYVGENFHFGYKAAGTPQMLVEWGQEYGYTATVASLVPAQGAGERTASSTVVRRSVEAGDVAAAAQVLGRPFRVSGTVVRGAGRGGAQLGYPTANIDFDPELVTPADGVYAGWFTVTGGPAPEGTMVSQLAYPAAISVGTNPTFSGSRRTIEAFVLDEDADLYGRVAAVDFVGFVRGMEKFSGVEELLTAMARDVAQTRTLLGLPAAE